MPLLDASGDPIASKDEAGWMVYPESRLAGVGVRKAWRMVETATGRPVKPILIIIVSALLEHLYGRDTFENALRRYGFVIEFTTEDGGRNISA